MILLSHILLLDVLFMCFQGDKSGATAVVAFLRGEEIYVGWLGDSQAVLVREGKAERLVEPHKPEREVRNHRLTALPCLVVYKP